MWSIRFSEKREREELRHGHPPGAANKRRETAEEEEGGGGEEQIRREVGAAEAPLNEPPSRSRSLL